MSRTSDADPRIIATQLSPLRASSMGNTVDPTTLVRHINSNLERYEQLIAAVRAQQTKR